MSIFAKRNSVKIQVLSGGGGDDFGRGGGGSHSNNTSMISKQIRTTKADEMKENSCLLDRIDQKRQQGRNIISESSGLITQKDKRASKAEEQNIFFRKEKVPANLVQLQSVSKSINRQQLLTKSARIEWTMGRKQSPRQKVSPENAKSSSSPKRNELQLQSKFLCYQQPSNLRVLK